MAEGGPTVVGESQYLHKTTLSNDAYHAASEIIPGGVQGNIKFYKPYPITFHSANGAWLKDIDGNEYVDYLLSFGALILGHGHQKVKEAVQSVWEDFGTSSFGVPYPLEMKMVRKLVSLYPSIEQVRFTNSGLEATLLAIRLGMAYTGRPVVAKFAGHYHGGHEHVLVSTRAVVADGTLPSKSPESLGLPDYFIDNTEILPFNDIERCEKILRENKDRIGVIVLEPLQSGYIPADRDFLHQLRALTNELGMLLVFDEVKTGFRVRLGGAQEYYGIRPDLTALGKVLGGGFPVGAVGGRRDILELAAPTRSTVASEVVFHSGTFNGNPMSLMAGLKTIELLETEGNYDTLLKTTKDLRLGIEELGRTYGFPVMTTGLGSIFNVVFTEQEYVRENGAFDVVAAEKSSLHQERRGQLDLHLMKYGVFSKPYNRFSVSLAHDDAVVKHTLAAFEQSFSELRKSL